MSTGKRFELREINIALGRLNQISRDEYGVGLEDLLVDPSPDSALRVQRLVGIALKRPFAREAPPVPYSRTGARRSWPWEDHTLDHGATVAPEEFALLDQLRMPGPWNERKPLVGNADDLVPITWSQFRDDVDNERGLFKILALYVDDKLKRRDRKSFREYLDADESPRFEAGLDLSVLLFDAAVTGPVAALIGIPTVAVGVALVGIQYGYRLTTDTNIDRVGDQSG